MLVFPKNVDMDYTLCKGDSMFIDNPPFIKVSKSGKSRIIVHDERIDPNILNVKYHKGLASNRIQVFETSEEIVDNEDVQEPVYQYILPFDYYVDYSVLDEIPVRPFKSSSRYDRMYVDDMILSFRGKKGLQFQRKSSMVVTEKATLLHNSHKNGKLEVTFTGRATPNESENSVGVRDINIVVAFDSYVFLSLNMISTKVTSVQGLPKGISFDTKDNMIKGRSIHSGKFECDMILENGNVIKLNLDVTPVRRIG